MSSAVLASPTAFNVTIPLYFGEHEKPKPPPERPDDVKTERRLRLIRYGMQLADGIISVIGYHAYAKCLSCLAFPGGGPAGAVPLSVAMMSANRPAEVDPLVAPFSRGIASLALGTLAYDYVDARLERHWSVERRESADLAEIGGHAWGISTWLPEIKNIHRDAAIASACGAQWQARKYGEAFTDGCVNAYYRSAGGAPSTPATDRVIVVCAPARFGAGTPLFTTGGASVVASGTACANVRSPFP